MLNIVNLKSTITEKIEVDPYVPVKIRWGQWDLTLEPTIYWRTGDFKNSLVEIGIASKSGIIRSFTVVYTKDIFLGGTQVQWSKSDEEGTPVFNISEWTESGRLDENGLAEIHYNGSELSVLLSRNTITRRVVSGRVCFDLDNTANLCAITVFSLSEDEKIQISDTLEYMCSQNKE